MRKLLEELFSAYYADVYRYLYRLCRDASLAEELVSENFLEAVKTVGPDQAGNGKAAANLAGGIGAWNAGL